MESISPDGPRQLLVELSRLVHDRASSEVEIRAELVAGKEAAEKQNQDSSRRLAQRFEAEKAGSGKRVFLDEKRDHR